MANMSSILRNSEGAVLASLATFKENVFSCVDAEGFALLFALRWARRFYKEDCAFETDCAEAFFPLFTVMAVVDFILIGVGLRTVRIYFYKTTGGPCLSSEGKLTKLPIVWQKKLLQRGVCG